MTVTEPDLIKEILSPKHSLCYGKSSLQQRGVCDFIGKGLLMANGEAWAHQRRVVAPAFNIERLKVRFNFTSQNLLHVSFFSMNQEPYMLIIDMRNWRQHDRLRCST